ncbi:hypothetical protein HMPREF9137_0613 [Prevotella denticola F0289]|nr:hypothetical protein HMPREF9137_0613 [Prevotella denticola F0289]
MSPADVADCGRRAGVLRSVSAVCPSRPWLMLTFPVFKTLAAPAARERKAAGSRGSKAQPIT